MKKHIDLPQIYISAGFCIIITLSAFLDTSGIFGCMLLSIIMHEAGHILAMVLLGVRIESVMFRLFGIEIIADLPYGIKRFVIMIAGPLTNLMTAAFFWQISRELAYCSFVLGIFHGLPLWGIDGGNALVSLFSSKRAIITAINCVKVFTFTASILLIFLSVYTFYLGQINISSVILAIYFIINLLSYERTKQTFN